MQVKDFYAQIPATPTQYLTTINGKRLWIKRDDLNDEQIQGNKLRKLKIILLDAEREKCALLSFGGAYSNHIASLSAAGSRFGIPTIGIIRGEELSDTSRQSHTLKQAQNKGMQCHFVSRSEYRLKEKGTLTKKLLQKHTNLQVIPEGGSNTSALIGASEIIEEVFANKQIPIINKFFCACGTGGTFAGILKGAKHHSLKNTQFIGVPVLKGADFLYDDIRQLNPDADTLNWELHLNAHEGGYAKTTPELLGFIGQFVQQFNVPLESVYTGKLCKAVFELAKQSDGKTENWLIYHSGGLQGVKQ